MGMGVEQEGSQSTAGVNSTSSLTGMASRLVSIIKNSVVSYFTKPTDHTDDIEAFGASGNHFVNSPPTNSITSQTHSTSASSTPRLNPSSLFHMNSAESPSQRSCQCQTHLSNPAAQAFNELEIGKAFLTLLLPIATIVLQIHNKESSPGLMHSMLCLLCIAMVALLYGISLRNVFPEFANAVVQLGIACIYASFFMVVGSHLPPALAWFPLACFIVCIVPSVYSCIPVKKKANVSSCTKVMKP